MKIICKWSKDILANFPITVSFLFHIISVNSYWFALNIVEDCQYEFLISIFQTFSFAHPSWIAVFAIVDIEGERAGEGQGLGDTKLLSICTSLLVFAKLTKIFNRYLLNSFGIFSSSLDTLTFSFKAWNQLHLKCVLTLSPKPFLLSTNWTFHICGLMYLCFEFASNHSDPLDVNKNIFSE